MKIDFHVHTKKIKSGDAASRNVTSERFVEILKNTDVRILAITNHNHFDLAQYQQFKDGASATCQIWPGIELDVLENGKRAHLIVLCNPKNSIPFNEKVAALMTGKSADTFTVSLKDTVSSFDALDCVYIAHYSVKKPDLGEEEIELLTSYVKNPKRILKEATNSISAGIYISHGHNSIYGTDIHDWNDYEKESKDLPELRLPVESFEQFCLLLEKDEATINTLLDKKVKETVEIVMFSLAELIRLDIYNDINILFGSKGTGKTKILDSLSTYFNSKGHKTNVYKSNDTHLNDVFLKKNSFNVTELGIDECIEEIAFLKKVTEVAVTSIAKYQLHFSVQETNRISQKLKVKSITKPDDRQPQREFQDVLELHKKFKEFIGYVQTSNAAKEYIDANLLEELISLLDKIITSLSTQTETKFFESKSVYLLRHIIDTFTSEIAKKTGRPEKPTETGFAKYARNRIQIEVAVNKILGCIESNVAAQLEYVGDLGVKGELHCKTNFVIQDGEFTNGDYYTSKQIKKNPQKDFSNRIKSISKRIYSNELFEEIENLNKVDKDEVISSINDLLLLNKHFVVNGEVYNPSNGESSMILLHRELKVEKDIYIIDEPEKSLGNDYINDVIVPLLKEKALLGKKVIIATHDANIAVRTLPYNSIYRLHDQNRYFTLTGNPFSNTLKCINKSRPDLDWKEISMKTLEGGRDAFGERGKIYGN